MRVSSIKTQWLISTALFFQVAPHARAAWEPSYKIRLNARFAAHVTDKVDLASHRYTLEAEQKVQSGAWTILGSARGYAEGAFATNFGHYGTEVRERDSEEVALRDLYVQYKDRNRVLRVGNQQVVWGEAFGFYFADLVNPKDYREFVLNDLSFQRIPTPMADLKFLFENASFEAIYIPKAVFDISAAQGSDYAFPFSKVMPGAAITVDEPRSLPLAFASGEAGGKLSALIGGLDLSLFYLYYFDRAPRYTMAVTSASPLTARFTAEHSRVHSLGSTATYQFSDVVIRVETVFTKDRMFDGVSGTNYFSKASDEWVGVVGLDYSRGEWRAGLQLSERLILENIADLFTPRYQELLGLHVMGTTFRDQNLDVILSYLIRDGSSLVQVKYQLPISSQFDVQLATDLFFGGEGSRFGQFKRGSRVYAQLRGFFGG